MPQADEPLRALTGYLLRRTTSTAMSKMNVVFAGFGLRRTTYATLSLVVETPGQRQGQVAAALAIDRPNFVQIVDELEEAGLVSRKTAVDDKRAYALHATSRGQELYKKARVAVRDCDRELTQGMTQRQLDDLHNALDVIGKNACREGTKNDH